MLVYSGASLSLSLNRSIHVYKNCGVTLENLLDRHCQILDSLHVSVLADSKI